MEQNQGRNERERNAKLIDYSVIQTVLGLLYLAAVVKSGRVNVNELRNSLALAVEIF